MHTQMVTKCIDTKTVKGLQPTGLVLQLLKLVELLPGQICEDDPDVWGVSPLCAAARNGDEPCAVGRWRARPALWLPGTGRSVGRSSVGFLVPPSPQTPLPLLTLYDNSRGAFAKDKKLSSVIWLVKFFTRFYTIFEIV